MERKLKLAITGHIDHGKSTLIGRLMYEGGNLPEDVKRELETSEFAHLTDHLEEERLEEKTIDTAQTFFKTSERQYVIIDTPGHKEFLRNMLTGASQADAAILIISAKEGMEEQTKRHAYLLKFLGIKQVILAINKMDTINYSIDRFKTLKDEALSFLTTLGILPFNAIPISARYGDNIAHLSAKLPWYKGATIFEALEELTPKQSEIDSPLRMPVQGIFLINGSKLILGQLVAGRIKVGERVEILPSKQQAEIAEIKVFGQERREAIAGESIGLLLEGGLALGRGDVISDPTEQPNLSTLVIAHIFWMDQKPFIMGEELTLKCATDKVPCRIERIMERINSSSLELIGKDADRLEETEAAAVTIKTKRPLVFEDFEKTPELGRFVLQRGSSICAGGVVSGAR